MDINTVDIDNQHRYEIKLTDFAAIITKILKNPGPVHLMIMGKLIENRCIPDASQSCIIQLFSTEAFLPKFQVTQSLKPHQVCWNQPNAFKGRDDRDARASGPCPGFAGGYLLSDKHYTFDEAKAYCEGMNMGLATVESEAEWNSVMAATGSARCGGNGNCGFFDSACGWFWLGGKLILVDTT